MTPRYISRSTLGKRSPTLRVNNRVRVCEACLARGVRVSPTCWVDGDVACDACGVSPSRGVIGLAEGAL